METAMLYQRLHIRVPASGEVILLAGESVRLRASAINISAGGLCISAPSHILDQDEYQIQIFTPAYGEIEFSGLPVYQSEESIGIKITSINDNNLREIYKLVEDFQLTEDFIKHIDEHNIIDDWFADDAGNDLSITFETITDEEDEPEDTRT